MEDNKNVGYTDEGRRLRPRRPRISKSDSQSESRPYGNSERKSYGDGERRPYSGSSERRSYGSSEHRSYGEHRNYGERRSYGERSNFSGNGSSENGSSEERRSYSSERRSYGEHKNYGSSERRSYGSSDRRSSYGNSERRSYGEHRNYGEHKSFGEHKNYGERRNFSENNGAENSSEERRPYSSERRSYGERKNYGSSERRSYGSSDRRGSYGDHKSFGDRNRSDRRGGYGKPSFNGRGRDDFKKKTNRYAFNENEESGINQMISRKPLVDNIQLSDADVVPTAIQEEVRLNKYIANSGVCSRREADQFIQAGVVTVNGEVVTELGTKVNVLKDEIKFNGERLKGEEKVYIVMNKPKGYVTTASDPHADKTVLDLLKGCDYRVFPVGRLDKNTTGVLMFTNDGDIAEKLTHPSYDKKKIYQVILDRDLEKEDFDKVLSGITLNDGDVKADELEYIDAEDHKKLGIEIHSGKNRIVRRIFESLGYDVKALDRVYFAGLTKKGLKKGEWRYLSEGEANVLKMGAYV